MARLHLVSLESFRLEQWNDDVEPYILINGEYFWESNGQRGLRKVEFPPDNMIEFTGQAVIELKDGGTVCTANELLGVIEVYEEQAGKGEFDHFIRSCGMIYKLNYEVLR